MKAIYLHAAGALALSFTIAACVPSAEQPIILDTPPPVTQPAPTPAPAPTPSPTAVVQQPTYENYLDAPQTPGTWEYVAESSETFAFFGEGRDNPKAIVRCDLNSRQLAIGRFMDGGPTVMMTIKAETAERRLEAYPRDSTFPLVAAELSTNDPLMDAIAITKGRFVIAAEGAETLYVPAWVEVSRVIEDCR